MLDAFRLAYKREPRLRLVLLGGGPLAPRMQSYIAQHGLCGVVWLLGQRPEEELPEYFRSADVYLSCAPSDGSSISLLCAIASGLPVVVSDRPSNREWVRHDDNGWLAKAGDPESFARVIVDAAHLDPDRRRRIMSTNREIALQDADWDRNISKLYAAYELLHHTRFERCRVNSAKARVLGDGLSGCQE
jgi:glycosyltransferase involved in cell wall biosynthesis